MADQDFFAQFTKTVDEHEYQRLVDKQRIRDQKAAYRLKRFVGIKNKLIPWDQRAEFRKICREENASVDNVLDLLELRGFQR